MSIRLAFLAKLREGLAVLPAADVDDIVAEFDLHFAEALASGRPERQAALRLGDPGWLAGEYLAPAWPRWGQKDPASRV